MKKPNYINPKKLKVPRSIDIERVLNPQKVYNKTVYSKDTVRGREEGDFKRITLINKRITIESIQNVRKKREIVRKNKNKETDPIKLSG